MHGTIILTILYALILPGCVLMQPIEPLSPVPVAEATRITAPAPSQPIPAKEEAVPEALTLERSLDIALKNNPEVAATVNEGVLLLTFAEELRQHDNLTPLQAVIIAAKIRLRPRLMIALAIIFGFIPLALNLEEGGEVLQPMAAGAIGGLALGLFVALFLMPCFYVLFQRREIHKPVLGGEVAE